MEESKECCKCNQELSLDNFYIRKRWDRKKSKQNINYSSWCRKCESIYRRHRNYNISEEQVNELLSNAQCEICGRESYLVIDHCHETGDVRGVLCNNCNTGIGMFLDSLPLIKQAWKYLKK